VPSLVDIARGLGPLIAEHIAEGQQIRRLPDAVVDALRTSGIFRMLLPRSVGGLEVDIHEALEVIEEITAADGSTGWCVVKGAPSNMAAAYLQPDAAKEIWADPTIVCGGSFNPMGGRAERVDGGYVLTGRWDWGTGVTHCAYMTCGGFVTVDGQQQISPMGTPVAKAFLVPAEQVTVIDTWHAHGMRATGSHDFAVDGVFVPDGHSFDGLAAATVDRGGLYSVPYIMQFALPHGILAVGLARASVDSLVELATGKVPLMSVKTLHEREVVQHAIGQASAIISAARHHLHGAATRLWAEAADGAVPSPAAALDAHIAAVHATQTCLTAVDAMFAAAGGSAVNDAGPIQRQWRDIHVAAAHFLVNDDKYTQAGKHRVGLPHGLPSVQAAEAAAAFAGSGGNIAQR
jgi:indole-3-acetate monooxygenase